MAEEKGSWRDDQTQSHQGETDARGEKQTFGGLTDDLSPASLERAKEVMRSERESQTPQESEALSPSLTDKSSEADPLYQPGRGSREKGRESAHHEARWEEQEK